MSPGAGSVPHGAEGWPPRSPHTPRPPLLPGAHPSTKTPQEVRFGQEAAAGAPVHKQRGMPRRHSLRTQAFCSPLTTDTEQDRPPA